MIILTDGIPNVAIPPDGNTKYNYFSDEVINQTKESLKNIEKTGVLVNTMLTKIKNEDGIAIGDKTYKQIIEATFGTSTNPTAGNFYYVTDDKIEQTITQDIYNSLLPIKKTYKDITIVDYFPEEIINNFDFAYVSEANIGNISTNINKENNSITWTIPELSNGETATVQYKLKLKRDFDDSIVNKIINTNEKVDITYKDFEEYTIKVTNEGEIEGYAKEIKDRIPDGLAFYEEDNTEYNWKVLEEGIVTTDYLKDTLLKPGESATVPIVLRWVNSETNLGQKINVAEISKDENEYGVPDIDSTPDNNKDGEDDQDEALVLLSINTGSAPLYITLITIITAILGTGAYLIYNKVKKITLKKKI